jgi:hypothetical protein
LSGIISFYQLKNDNPNPTNQWQNASAQTKETHDYFASVVEKELDRFKIKTNAGNGTNYHRCSHSK